MSPLIDGPESVESQGGATVPPSQLSPRAGDSASSEQGSLMPRTLDDAIEEALEIVEEAQDEFRPTHTLVLFSGGNDSTVLTNLVQGHTGDSRGHGPHVGHVNTQTGIPETTEYVRQTCKAWGLGLIERTPPVPYEEVLELIGGFPGPAQHRIMYQRLKERPLLVGPDSIRAQVVGPGETLLLITGVRAAESRIRMGYGRAVNRDKSYRNVIWANPLYHWSDKEMSQYRDRYKLPRNEVSDHLHMSGECLCGAFAKPQELEMIRFFYPEVAERIDEWEMKAVEKGLRSCKWGVGGPHGPDAAGPLCSSCVGQESFDVA